MLEYRAYHKSRSRRRGGGKALRKKERSPGGDPQRLRERIRLAGWIAAALLAAGLTGAAFASACSWLGRSSLFQVRDVDMNRCANVSIEEVWAAVRSGGPANLWSLSSGEVARRLSAHPWIRTVTVRKCFPDRLVVRIGERRAVAMVNLDALYYLDDEGMPFKRLTAYDPKNLAIVTGFSRQDLVRKDPVTEGQLRKTLDLLRGVENGALRQNVSEVHFDALDGYTVVTRDAGIRFKVGALDAREAVRRIESAIPILSGTARSSGIVDLKTEGKIFVRAGE